DVSRGLLELGYPAAAQNLLLKITESFQQDQSYWSLLLKTADELKQPELVFSAASRAYALSPRNISVAFNYAKALLVAGSDANEATKIAMQIFEQFPDSVGAQLNHAIALLRNARASEAKSILAALDPQELTEAERATYYLGWAELQLKERDYSR